MKNGDLVSVIRTRFGRRYQILCVALKVTAEDIRLGTNVRLPGLYLFRGYWYGTDPLNHHSYGKIEGQYGKVVGRLRTHLQARHLCL